MTFNNQAINVTLRSDFFASHFLEKVNSITNAVNPDPTVFNGTQEVAEEDLMFMSIDEVKKVYNGYKNQKFRRIRSYTSKSAS